MLDKLLSEERDLVHQLFAKSYGVREVIDILSKTYPESHVYHEQSFYNYKKSEEGKNGIDRELETIREEAKTHSFAHRGSRVAALVEISESLLNKIRTYQPKEVGNGDYIKVSGEFRRSLQDIKAEVEILGLGDSNALDIFAAFSSMVKSEDGLPSFVKKAIQLKPKPTLEN